MNLTNPTRIDPGSSEVQFNLLSMYICILYMFGFSSNLDPFRCQPDQNYLKTQPDPVEPPNWVQIWFQPKKAGSNTVYKAYL